MIRSSYRRAAVPLAGAALCLPLLIGACSKSNDTASSGEQSSTTTTAASVNQGPSIIIGQGDPLSFTPSQATAKVGQVVTWKNDGSSKHQVQQKGEPKLFQSELMQPGQQYVFTPTSAGTYEYLCSIHPDKMQGTLVVS